MTQEKTKSYHPGLEAVIYDLVRVGSTGFASGVSQMASRLIRSVPAGVDNPEEFRQNIHHALKSATKTKGLRFAGGQVPTDELTSSHLIEIDPLPSGAHLTLNAREFDVVNDIVLERHQSDLLDKAGIPLTSSVMFTGPPGVGKSLAARWIAEKLELPLVTLSLSATVSSHLGTSGKNVKSVLDYAQSGPCVLFLDEFDAIAKNRDDETDIGELKRIVNVLLIELDRWPQTTLLLAATNHAHLLDPAVERRFDTVVKFDKPNFESRKRIFANVSKSKNFADDLIDSLSEATEGATGSDIERIWNASSRRSVLHSIPVEETLGEEILVLSKKFGNPTQAYRLLSDQLGWSNRRIAACSGVTHPTVASALKRKEVND